jgi:hypothetical protein
MRLKKIFCLAMISYLVLFHSLAISLAQSEINTGTSLQEGHKYRLALGADNELLMQVNVWGEVKEPGTLQVPDNIDLISLLSFAGGPTENAKLDRVKLIRSFSPEKEVKIINVEKYLKKGNHDQVPIIKPGDTVVVPRSSFHSLTRFISFIYNVAVIASVIHVFTQD